MAAYPITAVCEVGPEGKPCGGGAEAALGCTGTVTLTQTDKDTCRITYIIKGLTPGLHGFHIHEKADFSNGCASAGPHYNPFKKLHGAPTDEERHVGDLGNIKAGADGVAKGEIIDKLVKLEGEFTVVGRSFMVHADPDDLGRGDNSEPGPPPVNGKASRVTGNAGARVACGEIKLISSKL
uniref:Superoxide dismutase [Cu-Zn] n=1 Tax=Alexandrium catenella TaxID=2925 RepID=A0A7S1QMR8_ALECA